MSRTPEQSASRKRAVYARCLAATGLEQYSAEKAGYQWDAERYRLRQDPRIAELVAVERARLFNVELAGMAYSTLHGLLEPGAKVPPAVKYQAARYVLEACGHHKQEAAAPLDMDKPLTDMTLAELASFIRQGEETLQNMRAIPGNTEPNTEVARIERLEVADLLA